MVKFVNLFDTNVQETAKDDKLQGPCLDFSKYF